MHLGIRRFTLLELLIVIAIITLLGALLIPVLGRARETGRRAVCLSNLRQAGLAMTQYAETQNNRLPQPYYNTNPSLGGWPQSSDVRVDSLPYDIYLRMLEFGLEDSVFRCPTYPRFTKSIGWTSSYNCNLVSGSYDYYWGLRPHLSMSSRPVSLTDSPMRLTDEPDMAVAGDEASTGWGSDPSGWPNGINIPRKTNHNATQFATALNGPFAGGNHVYLDLHGVWQPRKKYPASLLWGIASTGGNATFQHCTAPYQLSWFWITRDR